MASMETIYLNHPPVINDAEKEKVIAIGYFDGVHIGHQKLIKTAVDYARQHNLEACVMTFHPHPSVVLKQLKKRDDYLTPPAEKARIIAEYGVDKLYFVTFDSAFSQLDPQQFVDDYLIHLKAKHVVAGFDFTYGRMAKGNMETLENHSRGRLTYTVIPKVSLDEEKVSTTKIRDLIKKGQVDHVRKYLGRYYQMTGKVVHGDKRGRTIGFPTANIECLAPYVYPELGVYAVRLKVDDSWYEGVCNVGHRPTFHNQQQSITIEVHAFDFNQEIYDKTVTVEWHYKIRNEQKFNSIDELVQQIERDKATAIAYFNQ